MLDVEKAKKHLRRIEMILLSVASVSWIMPAIAYVHVGAPGAVWSVLTAWPLATLTFLLWWWAKAAGPDLIAYLGMGGARKRV